MQKTVPWWTSGVLYQVYPRSFQDSDGDGVGDLSGIIRRLPYLRELGVDAVWLSPIFASPMEDFGYDISDYIGIDPLFGALGDFDALVAAVHGHGLKLILDLVPNHTSEQHPWFVESRSSRDNPKRDWFIWRDGAGDGGPPTNWLSEFGGSAWHFDELSGQYYYHAFLRQQPDLNWRNPDVRQAIAEVMRFWLKRGVDGFRVDVMWHLIKDDQFRDNPPNPDYAAERQPYERLLPLYSTDRPEVHAVVAELRQVMDAFDDRVLIGEIYLPPERLVAYYGENLAGAHLPFNFALISTPWSAAAIAKLIAAYEAALPPGAWPNWVLGNHDRMRIASRVGADQARLAAMLLLTLRGTPTLYYGDEIGLPQIPIAPEQVRDPFEKNVPGFGIGRDGCRTPMQWDGSSHSGFSSAEPWLPLSDNFRNENVASQSEDMASILNLYRTLIALRRARPELSIGDYNPMAVVGNVLVFQRAHNGSRLIIALNFGTVAVALAAETVGLNGQIVLSTVTDRSSGGVAGQLELRGGEGIILEPVA
ncbi:alpha-amylase family glycosyl hydrolase [Bradyrhizobium prioriisuperbiae]|uniref:alpha-amylase family glycosyl hydrolase n=1 Tax=Bradyrhizobium prioriisuperbiae TaxID=2854389 RepID=UPI0028E93ED2|nr:alpha-amylase family glycosyl hydrolase [Bradyrhizobium prioritasuperba]